jgi:hypothetical protein
MAGTSRAAWICAVLCAAALAPAASAAERTTVAHTPGELVADPVLAGSNFVFADERARQTRLHVVSASGRSRVLSQFPRMVTRSTEEDESGELDFTRVDVALDASTAGVALGVVRQDCHRAPSGDEDCLELGSEYWVAAYRGPARRVLRCKGDTRDVGVAGRTVAVLGCPTRSEDKIHLFDLPTGTARRTIAPPRGYDFVDVDAAGPFVAGEAARRNDDLVIVYDGRSGRELYRAPSSAFNEGEYVLQADGKLVVPAAEGAPECGSWYSPSEPVAHPLTFRPCIGRMANDRIVTIEPADPRGGTTRLVLTDLRGSPPVAITPPADLDDSLGFDFDGRRVLEAVPVCHGVDLVAEHLRDMLRRGPRRARRCQGG